MIFIPSTILLRITQFLLFGLLELIAWLLFQKAFRILFTLISQERRTFFEDRLQDYICGTGDWQAMRPRYPGDMQVILELLLEGAENFSGDILEQVRQACAHLGIERRLRKGLRSTRSWIRAQAAWRIGQIGTAASVPDLVKRLHDRSRQVRLMSMRSLAALQGELALDPLLHQFTDLSLWARLEMAEIVESLGPAAVPIVIKSLQAENPLARLMAMDLLGHRGDPRAWEALLPFLKSDEREERIRAVKALGRLEHPEVLATLRPLINDPVWEIRLLVCKAMGRRGTGSEKELIEEHMHDPHPRVAAAAREALTSLGGA